ncbi:TPA: AAA family ATPase [Raoultella planticola]
MIHHIRIQNFRSVRDIELELGALNIVFGPNGCGKSNIYKAIHLLTASADGKFSSYISEEGGLENVMWSGRTAATARHPRRLQISCLTAEFDYELQVGFPEKLPYPTQFMLDPIVKEESIWLAGFSRRPSARVLQRKNQAAFLLDVNGEKNTFTDTIYENESIFGQLGEPHRFPEVSRVRETMRQWRFYHEFNISRHSALRHPTVGYRSPVLDSDGHNLAAAFQTIVEIGAEELLHEILAAAFPECAFFCENENSRFSIKMRRNGVFRPLLAAEMSDGTLRFLFLAVALLSPRPPAFLAINEPENSLHRQMFPALARLIVEASRYSQIWLTSHSAELAALISSQAESRIYELENSDGETRIKAAAAG